MTIPCLPARPVSEPPRASRVALACDCHFHIFGAAARYPFTPRRDYTPPEASLDAYRAMAAQLGLERHVIVQPSVYGTDNSCTLDALAALGREHSRAVVVLDETAIQDSELAAMTEAGVRGVRFNMVNAGGPSLDQLSAIARRIAPFGWHVQLFLQGQQISDMRSVLAQLATPVVIDHMGLVIPGSAGYAQHLDALRGLLGSGRAWVKLCGYRASAAGHPYHDVAPLARALLEAAPERCVWGTDWPHPGLQDQMPDDAHLFDLLAAWAPAEDVRRRVLVDNPAHLYGF